MLAELLNYDFVYFGPFKTNFEKVSTKQTKMSILHGHIRMTYECRNDQLSLKKCS